MSVALRARRVHTMYAAACVCACVYVSVCECAHTYTHLEVSFLVHTQAFFLQGWHQREGELAHVCIWYVCKPTWKSAFLFARRYYNSVGINVRVN